MAKITGLCVGESLVGEGNEVAHIDLIMGPRGSAAETAFANCLDEQQGRLHVAAGGGRSEPAHETRDRDVQQGHDQGRQAGGADVRPGAACGRDGGRRQRRRRHDSGGRGRQPVHLRRRVHPLGSGRRQEDPGIQLPGREGIDRSAPSRVRRRRRKSSPSATTSSIRSPPRAETTARRQNLRRNPKGSCAGWVGCSGCHDRGERKLPSGCVCHKSRIAAAASRPSCNAEATSAPAMPACLSAIRSSAIAHASRRVEMAISGQHPELRSIASRSGPAPLPTRARVIDDDALRPDVGRREQRRRTEERIIAEVERENNAAIVL